MLPVDRRSRFLVMVNKGVGQRGFRVCPDCGRSGAGVRPWLHCDETHEEGRTDLARSPVWSGGVVCAGVADGPFYLGHEFPTDALLLRLRVTAPVQLGAVEL